MGVINIFGQHLLSQSSSWLSKNNLEKRKPHLMVEFWGVRGFMLSRVDNNCQYFHYLHSVSNEGVHWPLTEVTLVLVDWIWKTQSFLYREYNPYAYKVKPIYQVHLNNFLCIIKCKDGETLEGKIVLNSWNAFPLKRVFFNFLLARWWFFLFSQS